MQVKSIHDLSKQHGFSLVFRPEPYSVGPGEIVYITFIKFKLT